MVSFRVRDLDAMTAQLQAAGIADVVDPEHYLNGRFARLHDPEGNPIEPWQAGRSRRHSVSRKDSWLPQSMLGAHQTVKASTEAIAGRTRKG